MKILLIFTGRHKYFRNKMRDCLTLPFTFMLRMDSSVAQSCVTLCDPMNCSTPDLPVHHQLPEFTQTHVHWVSDAIQSPHPLLSPSLPAFNLSQHQGLLQWIMWPKYWTFSISPSNEYSGLISFLLFSSISLTIRNFQIVFKSSYTDFWIQLRFRELECCFQ